MLENPVEYFEELPLYPEWVENSKLLFTWSAKKILEEDDKEVQESLIRAQFIQSERFPGYYMNLAESSICDCDACIRSTWNTAPVKGCPIPLINVPFQNHSNHSKSWGGDWEKMFKFAWKTLYASSDVDTSFSSDTDTSESSDISEDGDPESDDCVNNSK